MGGGTYFTARALVVWLALAGWLGESDEPPAPGDATGSAPSWLANGSPAALSPLPKTPPALDGRRVALGRTLFADRRLSGDGLVACSDCHQLALGGSNGQPKSVLPNRRPVAVNVPTIFNLAFDFRYAWNGRFERLEDQIDFALALPSAMGNDWAGVVSALSGDSAMRTAFEAAYPDRRDRLNARDAHVTNVRSLVTPPARFVKLTFALAPRSGLVSSAPCRTHPDTP